MDELVNVYAKTEDGWKLVYKDIPEDIATEIWRAGFKTGENNISIERKYDREFFKRQIKKLHKR
jgi:hypothetical protein